MFEKKFTYPVLERITDEETGVRHYVTPTGSVYSVTTILSKTGDKTFLEEWIKRVGPERAEQERRQASSLGTIMHAHLENHITGEERPGGTNLIYKMARRMADVIITSGLTKMDELWGMEEHLYYPGLYAGTADLIGTHQGDPAIVDFKSAKKLKTEDMIEDYFIQGCAYAMAHNKLFETNISKVVIFMVDRSFKYREFVLHGNRFERYTDKWLDRLDAFYARA